MLFASHPGMTHGQALLHDLKQAGTSWSQDHATRLASSLAYYTLLSLAPMMVLAVAIAAWFLGDEAARGKVADQVVAFVGPEAGKGVQEIIQHAQSPKQGIYGTLAGLVVLLFGASGVFGELQAALNTVWHVEPKPGRGVWGVIRDRFTSFTMVLSVGFVLLVSLILTAVLAGLGTWLQRALPGGETIWASINFAVSFAVTALLFALIFKTVPDVDIEYRHVWTGSLLTALLFTLGKYGLGLYLGHSSLASPYGAAGSLIVLVVWVYYSAQILLFGAEFTRARAVGRGLPVRAAGDAVPSDPQGPPAKPGAGRSAPASGRAENQGTPTATGGRIQPGTRIG